MTKPLVRCVNLDWLEVFAYEPSTTPHDAEYYRAAGYEVYERDYGTRVYKEMFTVYLDGSPYVEVRRNPLSQGVSGIHTADECHLRLVNAACYFDDAAASLQSFMSVHGYTFGRIARVDVCMDFELFDSGDKPAAFVRRYFAHKYSKINQGNITAHGKDTWNGQDFNSLSWGSPSSDIGTKLYNKTMELYDPKSRTYGKPHIRYAWLRAGLIDDFHFVTKSAADGSVYTPDIWRLEFSIRSSVKKWFKISLNGVEKDYQSIHNTLDMYDSRDKLLVMFIALQRHYFHFKYYEQDKRKDRCQDKVLFLFDEPQFTYKVGKDKAQRLMGYSRKLSGRLDILLAKLREYATTHTVGEVADACRVLIQSIESEVLRSDARNPWNYDDVQALRLALHTKAQGTEQDVAILIKEIKKAMALNNERIF